MALLLEQQNGDKNKNKRMTIVMIALMPLKAEAGISARWL